MTDARSTEKDRLLTTLDRGHLMGCSDPNDPTRRTTYGDAAAEIRRLGAQVSDLSEFVEDVIDGMIPPPGGPEDSFWNGAQWAYGVIRDRMSALRFPPGRNES